MTIFMDEWEWYTPREAINRVLTLRGMEFILNERGQSIAKSKKKEVRLNTFFLRNLQHLKARADPASEDVIQPYFSIMLSTVKLLTKAVVGRKFKFEKWHEVKTGYYFGNVPRARIPAMLLANYVDNSRTPQLIFETVSFEKWIQFEKREIIRVQIEPKPAGRPSTPWNLYEAKLEELINSCKLPPMKHGWREKVCIALQASLKRDHPKVPTIKKHFQDWFDAIEQGPRLNS